MPKQQNDLLVDLISRLTKAEKRYFKLYARRNATTGADALFIQLFEVISRKGSFDESVILQSVPDIKRTQIPNLRSKLYREVLASLRLQYSSQIVELATREILDFAQILYRKGLYRQCLSALDKAKTKADEYGLHILQLEIVAFEKHVEQQHITRSIDTKAEELSRESDELVGKVSMEAALSNLSLQLYGHYLRMGHARNKNEEEQIKSFFLGNVPEYDEDKLSFFEKLYLYQTFVWLYQITQEFAKQYRYAQKWVDLFHDEPAFIYSNIPLYIKGLHNLLNTLYLTLQIDKFRVALHELECFNTDGNFALNDNEESLHILFMIVHRLNLHMLEGTFDAGVSWAAPFEEILKTNKYNWDIHRVMVLNYKLACIHFGAGNNEKSIELLNSITNQFNPNLREDIQGFARILSLIAHFELGNDVLVSYQIKSVYRFLLKMKEMNATHSEILKFLRRTPSMLPGEVRDEFIELKETLLQIRDKQFERRSGFYLDIISWLESKIENRPVQDIIREKFLATSQAGESLT